MEGMTFHSAEKEVERLERQLAEAQAEIDKRDKWSYEVLKLKILTPIDVPALVAENDDLRNRLARIGALLADSDTMNEDEAQSLRHTIRSQEKEINDLQREAIVMAKENGRFRYYIVELERMVGSVALRHDAADMADQKSCGAYPDVPEVRL